MKINFSSIFLFAVSFCFLNIKAMSPEETNKSLLFLATAEKGDSAILGSSPGPHKPTPLGHGGKSISPEGSEGNDTVFSLAKKIDLAPFHELTQGALQVLGYAYLECEANNTVENVLRMRIESESQHLQKLTQDTKPNRNIIEALKSEIRAAKVACHMLRLLANPDEAD